MPVSFAACRPTFERIALAIEVLLDRRHRAYPNSTLATVPQVVDVRAKRERLCGTDMWDASAQCLPSRVPAVHGRPSSKEMERLLGPTTYVRRRALLSAQTRARQSMALSVVECGCALAGVGECRILIERRSGERVVLPQSSREGDVLRARVRLSSLTRREDDSDELNRHETQRLSRPCAKPGGTFHPCSRWLTARISSSPIR